MKTNELKKGAVVRLRNGWKAEIADNMKGDRRMAKVYGTYTETGSVYAHDIAHVEVNGAWEPIEHTPKQIKLRAQVMALGF